jgi:RNA polymerase sigma-70 factor (ECF subfamily)
MGESRDDEVRTTTVADMAILARHLQEHRDRLRRFLDRRIDQLKSRVSGQDLLQEIFAKAQRRWPGFEGLKVPPSVWLFGIARDCLIDAWRRHLGPNCDLRKEKPWPDRSSEQIAQGLVGSFTSPTEAAARRELEERVRQALDGLSRTDREIVWMRHFEGLTHKEAAAALGITPYTAAQRYCRAMLRLEPLLKDMGFEEDRDHERARV